MPSLENFSNETEFGEELMNILLKMGEIEEKPDLQTSVDGKKYRGKSDVKNDRYDEFIAAFNGILGEILRQGDLRKHQQSSKLNDGETEDLLGQEISSKPHEKCLNQEEAELLQKIKLLNRQLSGFMKSMSKGAAKPCASENKNAVKCGKNAKPRRYYRKPRGNEQFLITNPGTVDENQENPQDKLSEVSGAIGKEHSTESLHEFDDHSSATIEKRHTKEEHSSNTLNKENNYGLEKPTFTNIEDDDDDEDDEDDENDENDKNNDQVNPALASKPEAKDSRMRPGNSTNQRRQPSFIIGNNGIQIPLRLIKGPRNGLQLVLDRQKICCRCRKPKHPY